MYVTLYGGRFQLPSEVQRRVAAFLEKPAQHCEKEVLQKLTIPFADCERMTALVGRRSQDGRKTKNREKQVLEQIDFVLRTILLN